MTLIVNDPEMAEQLKAERRQTGADRFDEVWEGIYMMAPLANNEHLDLQGRFVAALSALVEMDVEYMITPGTNVSDRQVEWKHNYRCPDVVVFKPDTAAENYGTHWVGGPDLAVEIVSPKDRSREKLDFYGKVGTRELLIVDRDPWQLELYRLDEQTMKIAGVSTLDEGQTLTSRVLPCTLRLVVGTPRPRIEMADTQSDRRWTI